MLNTHTLALVCANASIIMSRGEADGEEKREPKQKRTRRVEPRGNPCQSSWFKQLNDARCRDPESPRWLSWRRRFILPRDAFDAFFLDIRHLFREPTLNPRRHGYVPTDHSRTRPLAERRRDEYVKGKRTILIIRGFVDWKTMSFSAAAHTIRFLVFPIDLLQHNTRLWLAYIA